MQIRPLRFLRIHEEIGPYLPVNNKRSSDPLSLGERQYMSAGGQFVLRGKEEWYIQSTYFLTEHPQLYQAFYQAKLHQVRFPTRRAAVQALEALVEAMD